MPFIVTSRTRAIGNRAPVGPVSLNKGSPQAKGLIAWYPSEGSSLTLARDYSGRHRNGTAGAATPTLAATGWGTAFDLNPGDEYTLGDVQALLGGAHELSGSCRIYIRSYGTSSTAYIRNVAGDDKAESNGTFSFRVGADGSSAGKDKLYGHMITVNRHGVAGPTALALDRWYTVGFSWLLGGSYKLWLDGRFEASASGGNYAISSTHDSPLRLGDEGVRGRNWDGYVKDLRFYDYELKAPMWRAISDPQTRWDLYWQRRRTYFIPAAPGGFQPAWARPRSGMIGAGAY